MGFPIVVKLTPPRITQRSQTPDPIGLRVLFNRNYKKKSIFTRKYVQYFANYANFQRICALSISQKNARDYFSMKLKGTNLWGKIGPSLTSFVARGSNSFKKWHSFFRKCHFLLVFT